MINILLPKHDSNIMLAKDMEQVKQVYEFIKKYHLNYPDYLDWVEKCKEELELGIKKSGNKKAFVYYVDNQIVGTLIFQEHKEDTSTLELKNARVVPEFQRKKIFSKLVREAEKYARENGYLRIYGDTHVDNSAIITALEKLGFNADATETLYSKSQQEVLLSKTINKNDKSIILYTLEDIVKH